MRVFALNSSRNFGSQVANFLDRPLDKHEERAFEDGECKIRPLVSVRDEDVYVIHALNQDAQESVHDKLCKLLFFIATLKDAGAQRVTAIIPYLCYARKDRRTKARDPVTIRYVASLFEAVNTDRVVTIDVHNLQAFQNSFRCKTEHLDAQHLFISYFKKYFSAHNNLLVMSPDIGGVKRAKAFRERLSMELSSDIEFAFMEKMRSKDVVSGEMVLGDVNGKSVIIIDDMICSGTTIARAAVSCKNLGAVSVYAVATHGAFSSKVSEALSETALDKILITNTVSTRVPGESLPDGKVVTLDVSPFFAEVIKRLHKGGSLVSLMDIE